MKTNMLCSLFFVVAETDTEKVWDALSYGFNDTTSVQLRSSLCLAFVLVCLNLCGWSLSVMRLI